MKFGVVLEHCISYNDEEPVCPECDEGHWIPVGMFTSKKKYNEWKEICGYETLPDDYRLQTLVPIDEGPTAHSSSWVNLDTGETCNQYFDFKKNIRATSEYDDVDWCPTEEEE